MTNYRLIGKQRQEGESPQEKNRGHEATSASSSGENLESDIKMSYDAMTTLSWALELLVPPLPEAMGSTDLMAEFACVEFAFLFWQNRSQFFFLSSRNIYNLLQFLINRTSTKVLVTK